MIKKISFLVLILNFIFFSVFSQNSPLRKMARGDCEYFFGLDRSSSSNGKNK